MIIKCSSRVSSFIKEYKKYCIRICFSKVSKQCADKFSNLFLGFLLYSMLNQKYYNCCSIARRKKPVLMHFLSKPNHPNVYPT